MADILESVQLALFERLIDVGRLLERRSDKLIREVGGIKFSQYEVLIRLRNAGGELRMTDLANKLVSTPSGLTYQLTLLEKDGLAERGVVEGDDRGVLARITPKGRELLLEISARQSAMILESTIDPLTRDEVDELHRMLGLLQIAMRGEATGGMLPSQVPTAIS
ncbi:MarR family transcriptional regulator [Herbiconiux moechotypicola]|uniref:MarR family transcriptional regulator n=1 Tax=Herbiconiux moechotypicola TaxID=637393 RepID=A0ABP5QNN3_9MICO|nr:MarR family transcriptional regulator [Herbiconiux moechotypicola]MCS5730593.1 MarR family transcriptional regulator [Herbiconiux moechotypicola]